MMLAKEKKNLGLLVSNKRFNWYSGKLGLLRTEPESLFRDSEFCEINVLCSLQRLIMTLTKRTKTINDTDRTAT